MGYYGAALHWWDGQTWQPSYPAVTATAETDWRTTLSFVASTTTAYTSTSVVLSGYVKRSSNGTAATSGNVTLQYTVDGVSWSTDTGANPVVTVSATGYYSFTRTLSASRTYRVSYGGVAAQWTPSVSAAITITFIPLKTYAPTFKCEWTASYTGWQTRRSTTLYQGYSAQYGIQKSLIGFPNLTAELAGATINKVELFLDVIAWQPDSGGTAVVAGFGTSSFAPDIFDAPGGYIGVSPSQAMWSTKTGPKWFQISNAFGGYFKSNAARSLALYTSSASQEYVGSFYSHGSVYAPVLRVTYTK